MAVASMNESYEVTIETDAFRQAKDSLQSYLTSSAVGNPEAGNVLAVVGEYGMGKTHLLAWLTRQVEDSPQVVYTIHADATVESFAELFRRIVRRLGMADLKDRVNEFYADVVARNLQASDNSSSVVQWLLNGSVEPQDVVQRMGMAESTLLQETQRSLLEVTGDKFLSHALTLLLRQGFDDTVWDWLMGAQPSQVLTERGITKRISSDPAALAMLGAFTLLLGGRRRPFVLVIDELDKVLTASRQLDDETLAALQTLLTQFSEASAFLVLAGLPDVLTFLRPAIRERIGRVVTMSPLSAAQVTTFIQRSQQHRFGTPRLRPFTEDMVALLVSLAGGTPRMVIKLCWQLYRAAVEKGDTALVTEQMVLDVVRRQFGSNHHDVRTAVRTTLERQKWPYLRDHFVGGKPDTRAAYWLPVGDTGGCAVLITESVLQLADVDRIVQWAMRVRSSGDGIEAIVVIDGVVADRLAETLRQGLGHSPLTYDRRTFAEEFAGMVGTVGHRLLGESDTDPIDQMRGKIEQINRDQAIMADMMADLVGKVDASRTTTDRQIAAMLQNVSDLTSAVRHSATAEATAPAGLPHEVDRCFTEALSQLDGLLAMNGDFQAVFPGQDPRDESRASRVWDVVGLRLRDEDFLRATGTAAALRQTISAFRRMITDWYVAGSVVPPDGRLTDAADYWLSQLCLSYDRVAEFLPVRDLEPLLQAGDGTGTPLSLRLEELENTLERLSVRVRNAAVRAVSRAVRD
jgi:Cdc6-like AAA superfamily ATPase